MGCQWCGYKFPTINGCSSLQKPGSKVVGRPAAKARGELRSTLSRAGSCRWLAFAAFLCWLKWNFCTREWFFAPTRKQNAFLVRERCRCYEKDTGLRRLLRILLYLLAVVFSNQWAYRQSCKKNCNLLNYKLLYEFKPVSKCAHFHKKIGWWAHLHSALNRHNWLDVRLLYWYLQVRLDAHWFSNHLWWRSFYPLWSSRHRQSLR